MGTIREHPPVLRLLAISSRYRESVEWVLATSESAWGPVALSSPWFPFDQTDYYQSSMGCPLEKMFLAFAPLMDPVELVTAKHDTNGWEMAYRVQHRWPEPRPVNLDPGYLSEAKLVLASTKDHAHRIYLGGGIFAEITLFYHRRRWSSHPWTYPDYRQSEFHQFFSQCRDYLRSAR